jgi:hypothetical protein
MPIIFIDSCAWDFMFAHGVELSSEFPANEFSIKMTKEVCDFEVASISADSPEKIALKKYIEQQKQKCGLEIDTLFGFGGVDEPHDYRHRIGGFDEGRFVSLKEASCIEQFKVEKGKERKTGLYKNEADSSLAVRACAGGKVLTAESQMKSGPLKTAFQQGGKVIFISDFDPSKSSFRNFVMDKVSSIGQGEL